MNTKILIAACALYGLSSGGLLAATSYSISGGKWTIDVPAGETNNVDAAAFAAALSAGVSDIEKIGAGGIVMNTDTTAYQGSFHIKAGTWRVVDSKGLGERGVAPGGDNMYVESIQNADGVTLGNVYVENGGTLEAKSATANAIHYRGKVIYFEGAGQDGSGALLSNLTASHLSSSVFGSNLIMTGDATAANIGTEDCACCKGSANLNMKKHTLTFRGSLNGAGFYLRELRVPSGEGGNIVQEGGRLLFKDYNAMAGSANLTHTVLGDGHIDEVQLGGSIGRTLLWNSSGTNDWTDPRSGTRYANVWGAPVELQRDITFRGSIALKGAISGPGGMVFLGGDAAAARPVRFTAANTFAGALYGRNTDFTFSAGSLSRSQAGFTAVDSNVTFADADYDLPAAVFDVSDQAAVSGGWGSWDRSLVKSGAGRLDYDTMIAADRLEVTGGEIAVGGTPSTAVLGGLIAGRKIFPTTDDVAPFFNDDVTVYTNEVQNGFNAANNWSDSIWMPVEGEDAGSRILVTYSGYLCNGSPGDVTWSFILGVYQQARLIIDGVHSISQMSSKKAQKMTLTLSPGWHHVVAKFHSYYDKTSKNPGGGPGSSITNVVKTGRSSVGLLIDVQGRDSWDLGCYADLRDAGGSLFRWTDAASVDTAPKHPVTGRSVRDNFGSIRAVSGTAVSFGVPAERCLDTFEGFTAMTGENDIEVARSWTIDAAALKDLRTEDDGWTTDGKVTFADGARIRIAGVPFERRGSDPRVLTILKAEKGVFGDYEVEMDPAVAERWQFSASDDGKRLLLTYKPKGLLLIFR